MKGKWQILHWGVYFVVFSIVFVRLGAIDIVGFTLNQVLIVALLFTTIVGKLFFKRSVYHINSVDIFLILFGVYLWISNYLVSPNPDWGLRVCVDYLRSLACYFLVIFLIDTRSKIRFFMLTYIIASVAMAFTVNLFSKIDMGITFTIGRKEGLTGLAGHYINYAIYSIMSIPIAYTLSKNTKKVFSLIFTAIAVILSLAALFSGSRGGVVSWLVVIIIIAIIQVTGRQKVSVLQMSLLSILSISTFGLFLMQGGGSLLETFSPAVSGIGRVDPSLHGRIMLNKFAFATFFEHPLFGIGIETFRNKMGNVPHNEWLQIATELGVTGLLLSGVTVFFIFRNLRTA